MYYLIVKEFKDIHLCIVKEKYLIPDLNKINYNKVQIISLKTRIKKESYKGTIIEGKLISKENNLLYLSTDVHLLNGEEKSNLSIIEKYNLLDTYIENNIFMNLKMNNINIKVSPLYEYDKLNFLVNEKIRKSNYNINGIIFIPKKDGIRYIFKEYEEDNDNEDYDIELKKDKIFANLLVDKLQTDVYNIYCLNKNNKVRIGIAHIPTIECSHYCYDIFENSSEKIVMKCEYNKRFNKWIPIIKLKNKTKPCELTKIKNRIATCVTDI